MPEDPLSIFRIVFASMCALFTLVHLPWFLRMIRLNESGLADAYLPQNDFAKNEEVDESEYVPPGIERFLPNPGTRAFVASGVIFSGLMICAALDFYPRFAFLAAIVFYFLFFTAQGLTLLYFFFEGTIRLMFAAPSNGSIGTLPLWLATRVTRAIGHLRDEHGRGPRLQDRVIERPDEQEIVIESCRERDWNAVTTLQYKEDIYQLLDFGKREHGLHRYIYRFRIAPYGFPIRKLQMYSPDELLPSRSRGDRRVADSS